MKDMDKVVICIEIVIKNEENILIYGDYDVDGIMFVVLLLFYFKIYYLNVVMYILDCYEEGYGIFY